MAKYIVMARDCSVAQGLEDLCSPGTVHELSDSEVIDLMLKYGRAEIAQGKDGVRVLCFHNDYD
jgi:hypothetical protein